MLFTLIIDNKNVLVILTSLGTLVSLYYLIRYRSLVFNDLKNNRYLYLCLAFLIPIGIAAFDTLYPTKRYSIFLTMILYLFIGILPIVAVKTGDNFNRLTFLTFYGLLFICLDAISQWLFGYHSLGHNPVIGSRVLGIFGEWAHLSYYLGTFAPIIFFYLYQRWETNRNFLTFFFASISLLLLFTGVMLGGARAGMIDLAVAIFLFIIYLLYTNKIKNRMLFIGSTCGCILICILILSQIPLVQERFIQTTTLYGNESFLYRFTTLRTNIWYVAIKEVPNYWINGVGTRAFDTLYQTYPADYKIFPKIWHPHLHGLEVLIETGLIGFIPYLAICGYLLVRMFTAKAGNMWLMVGFIALMPINSHVAIYRDYWLPIIWIPIMIGLALAYHAECNPAKK